MQDVEFQEYCDLCGLQGKFYVTGKNYHMLYCNRCGLIWTNPLKRHMDYSTQNHYIWSNLKTLRKIYKKRFFKQFKIFIKKANISDIKNLKILEVGSNLGFFLDICEDLNIFAEGCDIASWVVNLANRNRERVRLGTLDGFYKDESFDIILALNLIEHLTHPKNFLTETHRVLKSGGILVLETPIQESLAQKFAKISYSLSKGKINFLGICPGGHIYLFSKKTFKSICNDIEFTFMYQRNINSPFKELWSKSLMTINKYHRFIFRIALPIVWAIAKLIRQENRLFIILQKD